VAEEKKTDAPFKEGKRAKPDARATVKKVRQWVARGAWLLCALFALVLAVGALLIALHGAGSNPENSLYKFVVQSADKLDLGAFSRDNGLFSFKGDDALTKNALTNWGIAAVIWLVIGRLLDRVIRPR
jgi:hypothetical protein